MGDLDQLAISRILGSTIQPFTRPGFGGFATVATIGEMLASRPKPSVGLPPDASRDSKIVEAFEKTHEGYSVDRVYADPVLCLRFVKQANKLGVNASYMAICRRLMTIRKSGEFKVKTTKQDKRDLRPFLIPAELAFAQLTYRHDASADDLLLDPDVGVEFDALAMKIGRVGNAVDYRLAALHLRKNLRSRSGPERKQVELLDPSELNLRWHPGGPLSKVTLDDIPTTEGMFSLSEPNRYLFLTTYPNLRSGIKVFQDPNFLAAVGNRFWSPSLDTISLQVVRQADLKAKSLTSTQSGNLRLLELKSLEVYQPIFNLIPKVAA